MRFDFGCVIVYLPHKLVAAEEVLGNTLECIPQMRHSVNEWYPVRKEPFMALKRRQFTKEFKLQVIHEVQAGKTLAQAAREHEVHASTIIDWRKSHEKYAERAFQGNGRSYT